MLDITDEQLLSQCHAWAEPNASQDAPAERKKPTKAVIPQVAIEDINTVGLAAQQTLPAAFVSREPAESTVPIASSQHVEAVPSGQGGADEGARVMAGSTSEAQPSAPNDFCRSLLADLLGEPPSVVSAAPAAISGQPHDRLAPEAGPSDTGACRSNHASANDNGSTANGERCPAEISATQKESHSLPAADAQDSTLGRGSLPRVDLGPSLPFSVSAGSARMGAGKKLSLRERIKLLQSQ